MIEDISFDFITSETYSKDPFIQFQTPNMSPHQVEFLFSNLNICNHHDNSILENQCNIF
jgi:hypothetical protein